MSTGRHRPVDEDDADAALIVAAVNGLPGLLDSLTAAQAEIEGLRRERDEAIKDRDAWTAEWNDERNKNASLQSRLEQAEGLAEAVEKYKRNLFSSVVWNEEVVPALSRFESPNPQVNP